MARFIFICHWTLHFPFVVGHFSFGYFGYSRSDLERWLEAEEVFICSNIFKTH